MLKQKIQSDTTDALKQGNREVVDTLRMILAAISSKEKEKRYKTSKDQPNLNEPELIEKSQLSDEEAVDVLISEVKKRKDAIILYEKGNRSELAEREKSEINIIQKYLPEQMSEEELSKIIEEAVKNTGAQSIKDMGKVMAEITPKIKGRADGGTTSKIVKEILSM